MKKYDSFSTHNDHFIPLSEELRRVANSLREAESNLEFEMTVRNLERIIKGMEWNESESGT